MTGWDWVLDDLGTISKYFEKCMNNAADGSDAKAKFERWMTAVDCAACAVTDVMNAEREAADKPLYGGATDWDGVRCE